MINILVSFNKNYARPFQVMIKSLMVNNSNERFHVYLLHNGLKEVLISQLLKGLDKNKVSLSAIEVDSKMFESAHITDRYPQEMYYRLLAPKLLPESLDRILYLDPDILVINSIVELWNLDLGEKAFGAASHLGIIDIMNPINRIRLNTDHDYYNTGVILMDLKKARAIINPDDIFKLVTENQIELLLPDQDVFNHLYGKYTLDLDETIWNYDARYYQQYRLRTNGEVDLNWVIENCVILHFCGKQKPWHKNYTSKFGSLYKHYMHHTELIE